MTFGLSGFGGAWILLQPLARWRRTMTPEDMAVSARRFSRSGSFLQGAQELALPPGASLLQPEIIGVAFGSLEGPTTLQTVWTRRSAYQSPTGRTSLQFSTPKGYGF